jgi:hypothetical protein
VLSASQGIRDQFPGAPWIYFCNGYFEVNLFFLIKGIMYFKNTIAKVLKLTIYLFIMTFRNSPLKTKYLEKEGKESYY